MSVAMPPPPVYREIANRENYAEITPNAVIVAREQPVSTFSIDVDTGSFSNIRRMLESGQLPPADAVRTEELINWFDYGYAPPPSLEQPFAVHTELATAPWNSQRLLLSVGLKGYQVDPASIPASNLVFLVDTSGSMQSEDKLGLLKQSFGLLVERLRPQDRIAIVAYAGSAGLVLPPTSGSDKASILAALNRLEAGGSTNGGAGIELAYATAQQAAVPGGVNRVILATDGDFNVGTVSIDALESLVRAKRESGVALTTLGFGRDNYNDELAEHLADIGNGNHAYIDRLDEARKVLVDEMSSTLLTIASDVKIQIEFNPNVVAEYRLLGYENRALNREDFNNDKVDAGEIGAGHDVTALYEVSLVGSAATQVEPLRYAASAVSTPSGDELAWLKLRYKPKTDAPSRLIEQPIRRDAQRATPSARLNLAANAAAFAELLRGDGRLGAYSWRELQSSLQAQKGEGDPAQTQALLDLVTRAASLQATGR
ncbi:MAG: VWA domain-containing protein [Xanthomonadales bacterium]|nr:VWA domain-containing protein [Xanthomonadales bacterium]